MTQLILIQQSVKLFVYLTTKLRTILSIRKFSFPTQHHWNFTQLRGCKAFPLLCNFIAFYLPNTRNSWYFHHIDVCNYHASPPDRNPSLPSYAIGRYSHWMKSFAFVSILSLFILGCCCCPGKCYIDVAFRPAGRLYRDTTLHDIHGKDSGRWFQGYSKWHR